MVQSLLIHADREIPAEVLADIRRHITPHYLKEHLQRRGVPDRICPECGTSTYDCIEPYQQIPTEDLTLQLRGKRDFYGTASGGELSDKLLVKAVALNGIKEILQKHGIRSRIDFSDVADFEYARLSKYNLTGRKCARDNRVRGHYIGN